MTDIRLTDDWALTGAADGDAPLVSGTAELLQRLRLEAECQAGELFFEPDWGWSLGDFLQSLDTEMTRLEIASRIRAKLTAHGDEIDPGSLQIDVAQGAPGLVIRVRFALRDGSGAGLDIVLDRVTVTVEVVTGD